MSADFSITRLVKAEWFLKNDGVLDAAISDDAKVLYTVGLLVCDDSGRMAKADLVRAMADPSVVNAARQVLARAGEV